MLKEPDRGGEEVNLILFIKMYTASADANSIGNSSVRVAFSIKFPTHDISHVFWSAEHVFDDEKKIKSLL